MVQEPFTGDRRLPMKSPLAKGEQAIIRALLPRIPRWVEGYHLTLVTIPLCAVCIAAGYLGRERLAWLWLMGIPAFGVSFVSTYLAFAGTHGFKIDFLGFSGTEMRILLVLLNTAILAFGKGFVERALPYAVAVVFAAACVVVFRTQRYIWAADMRDKAARAGSAPALRRLT